MLKIIISAFFFYAFLGHAQSIQGIVIDSLTQQPVSLVNIYTDKNGTSTNSEGLFLMEIKKYPLELTISHIAYKTKKIIMEENPAKSMKIGLVPKVISLPEIVINDIGYKIAKKALEKLLHSKSSSIGKAFYRQVTKNNSSPSEFIETFNEVAFNSSGIAKYGIEEARYARTKSSKDSVRAFFTNFSYFSFGFYLSPRPQSTSKKTDSRKSIIKPFSPDFFDLFYYTLRGYFEQNSIKYALIDYEPLPNVNGPTLNGSFTVNLDTYGVINFIARTTNSLGADSLRPSKIPMKNHYFEWTVNFEDRPDPCLNSINATGSFEFSYKDHVKKVLINSTLIIFEKGGKNNKKLKEPDFKQNDIERIKKKRYNAKFWKDNPIIKRTQFEEEAISSFEKSNSFGSYVDH